MNLIQYSPNGWFDAVVNRVFSDFGPEFGREAVGAESLFSPAVEVRDARDAFVVSAELPGVEKEDLKVEVTDGVLSLTGSKKQETVSDEQRVYRAERSYGEFKRAILLPDTVDAGKIDAVFRNGVLKITLPKKEEAAPKQIAIRGDEDVKKIGVK